MQLHMCSQLYSNSINDIARSCTCHLGSWNCCLLFPSILEGHYWNYIFFYDVFVRYLVDCLQVYRFLSFVVVSCVVWYKLRQAELVCNSSVLKQSVK